ncbi:MAG: MFS transporter [Acidobacteriota bacterium]
MRSLPKQDRLAIFSLSAGHFINDAYSNFLGPLLPLLVAKFHLTITQAGWLAAILVFSSSFTQPFYGYISDRYLKRLFAVFSPLVTAVFMSCLGLASGYWSLAAILFCGGVGIASFHPQSAAMTALASGHRKGLGMSIFVTSGSLGYSLGPIIITYAVAWWGLEGSFVVMLPGMVVFALLYFLVPPLEHSSRSSVPQRLRDALLPVWWPLLLLYLLVVIRSSVQMCFVNFLPLYLSGQGHSSLFAGKITTLFLFFGAVGGFSGGALSERFGRRNVIAFSMLFSTPFLIGFLWTSGLVSYTLLALGGLILLSTVPVNVVMAQELVPRGASTVSALMMGFAWGMGGSLVPAVGKIADHFGLEQALLAVVLLPLGGGFLSLGLYRHLRTGEELTAPVASQR